MTGDVESVTIECLLAVIEVAVALCEGDATVAQQRKTLKRAGFWPPVKAREILAKLRRKNVR